MATLKVPVTMNALLEDLREKYPSDTPEQAATRLMHQLEHRSDALRLIEPAVMHWVLTRPSSQRPPLVHRLTRTLQERRKSMDQSQLIESHTITNSAGRHFEMKAAGDLKPGDTYLDAGTMRTAGSRALGCCVVAVIQEKRDAVLIYHEQHGHKLLHREEPVYLPLDGPVDAAPLQPEGVLEPAKLEAPPSAQTKTARISDLKEDLTEAEDLIAVALFGAVVDFDTIQKMAARALVAREALTELGVTPPKPRQSGFSDGEIDRAVSSAKSALEWIGSEVDRLQRDGGFALEWPASATALRSIRKDAFVEQIKTFRALAELCVQRYNERVQTPLTQQDLAELRRELDTTRA